MAKTKKQKQYVEVFCRFRFVGFHNWPDAPEQDKYLRNEHRHEFHFEVRARVAHNNRDIEFCRMREDAENGIHDRYISTINHENSYDFGSYSCEKIAQELHDGMIALDEKYKTIICIEVSEDGENGARVYFA